MKAAITGATGFVGKQVVWELLSCGAEVVVFVRDTGKIPKEWENTVEVVSCGLEELSKIKPDESRFGKIDYFFHFAWNGTSGNNRADIDMQLNNVRYTCDAVCLAAGLGCKRFIYAGSIMEYEVFHLLTKDGCAPGLGNIYSTAKLTADFMARLTAVKHGIDFINVIISNIYGAGERSARFFNSTIMKMLRNEDIPLTEGKQLYDFIYITDAATMICRAGFYGRKNESYYIGNVVQKPLKEYILQMKKVSGSSSQLLFGKVPFSGEALSYEEFDTKKAERELGYTPCVDFEQGIRNYIDWIERQRRQG